MFHWIRDFFNRHKRKLIIGSTAIGSSVLFFKYAKYRFLQFQEAETLMLYDRQKRRQHYESTKRTASTTVLSLSISVCDVIMRDLDSDSVLQAIRDQPENKHIHWQQLKVVAFSRAIAVTYTSSVLVAAIHVQLMLLGGYTYGDLVQKGHAGTPISTSIQQRYLLAVQYLVNSGLPQLVNEIEKATTHITQGLSLSKPLTLSQLEILIMEIFMALSGENVGFDSSDNDGVFKLAPWSHYILEISPTFDDGNSDSRVLKNMLIETADILDSSDFDSVVQCLVQQGLNHILDRVADSYPAMIDKNLNITNKIGLKTGSSNIIQDQSLMDANETITNNGDQIKHGDNSVESNLLENKYNNNSAIINPNGLQHSTLPVARIVPILSGLVHASLSSATDQLMQKLLLDDKLEAISCNVYEGFSVPLSKSL